MTAAICPECQAETTPSVSGAVLVHLATCLVPALDAAEEISDRWDDMGADGWRPAPKIGAANVNVLPADDDHGPRVVLTLELDQAQWLAGLIGAAVDR